MRFRIAGPAAVLLVMLAGLAGPAAAESTLEKVGRTGLFVVGTRTGSPPFAFVGKDNQWGGFSVDLARLVHAAVEKKVAKPVRFALKESTPATRIALLEAGSDLGGEAVGDTDADLHRLRRREFVAARQNVDRAAGVNGFVAVATRGRLGGLLRRDQAAFDHQLADLVALFGRGRPLAEVDTDLGHDGAHRMTITPGLQCKVETFGFHPEADYQIIYDAAVSPGGRVGVLRDGMWLGQWTNHMPGAHNALNSAAAGILAAYLGADWEHIAPALATFRGVDRRMQKLGAKSVSGGSVTVYQVCQDHDQRAPLAILRQVLEGARV